MSEIEWMPAGWDQVKPGDRVKLVHNDGEQAIIGTAADGYTSFMPLINNLAGGTSGVICFHSVDAEWSLFVERAKPALPTEPGLYRLSNRMVVQLNEFHEWLSPNDFNTVKDAVALSITFTRLESVPETAKKIFDRIVAVWTLSDNSVQDDLRQVATEFGVTEETNQ